MDQIKGWYLKVLHQYTDFSGRARRTEFWMFFVAQIGIYLVLSLFGLVSDTLASLLTGLYALATLLPSLAVGVRRLHDTGRSGWFLLLGLIPVVGLVLIYFYALEGDAGPNAYGPDPKSEPSFAA